MKVDIEGNIGVLAQRQRCLVNEIIFAQPDHLDSVTFHRDVDSGARNAIAGDDLVEDVYGMKDAHDLVVAIRATWTDSQLQVDLGR